MTIEFTPKGVCAKSFSIDVEDDVIQDVRIVGGCPGNLLGLSGLLKGMRPEEAIAKLEGIPCGGKATSCPDQIAIALKEQLG